MAGLESGFGQLALLRVWHQVPQSCFWKGVGVGLAAHTVVGIIAAALAR